jgi:hypothetical protein
MYTNYIYIHRKDDNFFMTLDYIFLALLTAFATYFASNEAKQLLNDGLDYLSSFWNYIDIIPPIGIYVIVAFGVFGSTDLIDETLTRTILSVITFFMWFKFLYFMRIFKNTGYLIRMIFEVIYDMRFFFLVLFVTITAFSDSFLSISLANEGEHVFVDNLPNAIVYTYRMILGDWDTEQFC